MPDVEAWGEVGVRLGCACGPKVALGVRGTLGATVGLRGRGAMVVPRTGHRRHGEPEAWIGRFALGDEVPLAVDLAAWPDSPPQAQLYREGVPVGGPLILAADGPPSGRFRLPHFLGPTTAGGNYTVAYAWDLDGVSGLRLARFEVTGGGDGGGAVISLHAFRRPEAQFVVAQLSSGRLAYGRNPGV